MRRCLLTAGLLAAAAPLAAQTAAPGAAPAAATITARDRLDTELRKIRRLGYATCSGELDETLYGVSAPLLDSRENPYAVVSIWGTQRRIPTRRFPELGRLVRRAAQDLEARHSTDHEESS